MATVNPITAKSNQSKKEGLLDSKLREVNPVSEDGVVALHMIEMDPTNPGGVTQSKRYERRHESLLDSFDILDGILYPLIVCEHPDKKGYYILIDGHGRFDILKGRGVQTCRAIIFPPLDLEERICLRQTLNAAQEPFDVVSILQDLYTLAEERGITLDSREAVKTLVRDLPAKVQKVEKDIVMLMRWDQSVIDRLGETGGGKGIIGLDQIRSLTTLMLGITKRHQAVSERLGGEKAIGIRLAEAFDQGQFSDGQRAQEGIRMASKAVKEHLPEDSGAIESFLDNETSLADLVAQGQDHFVKTEGSKVVKACKEFTSYLVDLDAESLSDSDRAALQRTFKVLEVVVPS